MKWIKGDTYKDKTLKWNKDAMCVICVIIIGNCFYNQRYILFTV